MNDSHPASRRIRRCDAYFHIPFRPVPVKPRHDGWTRERQRAFIDRLCVSGCVALSARAVGKSPQSAYRLRCHARAASFRGAWDKALEAGQSYQLDVALARAVVPDRIPVIRRGRWVGERSRYDNRLAMAALRALDRRAGPCLIEDQIAVIEQYIASLYEAESGEGPDTTAIEK